MAKAITATKLSNSQKIGLMTWRSMMAVFSLLTRSAHRSLGDSISQHRYGADPAERLDFMAPPAGSTDKAPLVYIHGGGWICGKMEMYTAELAFLAEQGYPVFNLEYPLAPERPHPHMLLSLLSALAWIRKEHPEHESVHLMGDSAGGNLALMLGILMANPELIKALDEDFSETLPKVDSIVSIYGVLDRLSWIEDGFPSAALMLECYAGPDALKPEVGPELAVTPMDLEFGQLPPTFISAGSKDQLAQSSQICADALGKRFDSVEYKVYPGEAHGFFNRSKRPASQELRGDILDFLSKA